MSHPSSRVHNVTIRVNMYLAAHPSATECNGCVTDYRQGVDTHPPRWEDGYMNTPDIVEAQFSATYPHLSAVLTGGSAYINEHGDIVGIAADGVEVSLGVTHRVDLAERYLTDFPTPAHW